jgi:hypothetical protein
MNHAQEPVVWIRVRNVDLDQEAVWSLEAFIEALFLMREIYNNFMRSGCLDLDPESNPFDLAAAQAAGSSCTDAASSAQFLQSLVEMESDPRIEFLTTRTVASALVDAVAELEDPATAEEHEERDLQLTMPWPDGWEKKPDPQPASSTQPTDEGLPAAATETATQLARSVRNLRAEVLIQDAVTSSLMELSEVRIRQLEQLRLEASRVLEAEMACTHPPEYGTGAWVPLERINAQLVQEMCRYSEHQNAYFEAAHSSMERESEICRLEIRCRKLEFAEHARLAPQAQQPFYPARKRQLAAEVNELLAAQYSEYEDSDEESEMKQDAEDA